MRRLLWAGAICGVTAIVGTTAGCNTQGCTDNRSALPLMGLYSSSTKARIVLDSLDIGGIGAPDDSLLISSGQSVQSLYLPFRYDRDETSFFIHYDYKLQGLDDPAFDDVITIGYTAEPYFASEECGAYYIYTIRSLTYTTHLIDSVAIVDSVINNIDMERIQVFFRIAEPEEPDTPDNPDEPGDTPGDPGETDTPGDNTGGDEPADATSPEVKAIKPATRRGMSW
ncbi:MAG: protein-lysine N-methyltransferase [Muribaculaceae bacterium]|nr:protein-lysine N-methyltransferase [Muribaculaceae bacterium]